MNKTVNFIIYDNINILFFNFGGFFSKIKSRIIYKKLIIQYSDEKFKLKYYEIDIFEILNISLNVYDFSVKSFYRKYEHYQKDRPIQEKMFKGYK